MLEAACFDCGKYRTDMVHIAHLCRDCPSFAQHGLAVSLVQSTQCPYWRLKAVPVWHWSWLRDTLWPWRVPQEVLKVVLVLVHATSCFSAFVPFELQEFATVCATGVAVCSPSLLAELLFLTVRFTKIHQHTHVLPTPHNVLPTPHIGNEHQQRRQLWARPYRQVTLTPSSIYLFDDWLTTSFV